MKERFERLRQRHRSLDVLLATVDKGGQDNAAHLSAVIAFFSFFSLFPLMLVFVWVLGALLDDELQTKLVDSALGRFPVIGTNIRENVGELDGGLAPLIIGLAGAVWAGTKAFEAYETAMHIIWHGVFVKAENLIKRKVRAVLMIVAFGIGLTVATAGSALVTVASWIPGAAKPAGFLISAVMNTALAGVMYLLATPGHPGWRALLPGSIVAGTALTALYSVGTVYLTRVVDGAGDTYGTFAVVIGLLTWLNLIGTVLVWSAELNSVLSGKRASERVKLGR